MDCAFIYKIILLTSLWNTLGFFGCKVLSLCFSKFRIANKRWCHIASNLVRGFAYTFCSTVLALNLVTVSCAESWKIIVNPDSHSASLLTEFKENLSLIEDIFVFVLSFFLTHTLEVMALNGFKCYEFKRSIFLITFLFSGYYCKFLGMACFIGAISSASFAVQSANEAFVTKKNSKNLIASVKKVISFLLLLAWTYLFGYLIPVYSLYPLMLKNATSVENRFCFNLCKASFVLYYFAEILNSSLVQSIRSFVKKFAESYARLFIVIYRQYYGSTSDERLHSNEKEETLKMYTAQGKSPQEIKRQMELMQMVKCVVAIRKKLKKAKENKEKQQSKCEKKEVH